MAAILRVERQVLVYTSRRASGQIERSHLSVLGGKSRLAKRQTVHFIEKARQILERLVVAAKSSFILPSRIHLDDQALSLFSLPQRASHVGRIGTLFLAAALGISAGAMSRVAAAVTNEGLTQTDNSQTNAGPSNAHSARYLKEEEKAIERVESAFGKYSSACIALFAPQLMGLDGEINEPSETAEMLHLKRAEGLLDPNSIAGAISEASVLISQPDSELTEWQRKIARQLKTPLPNYWRMSLQELSEAAKQAQKNYVQNETKAVAHPKNGDGQFYRLDAFLFARQLYAIRLAELWQRPETQKDPPVLDYIRSLLSDGKPPNIAHMPQEIPDGDRAITFVLFTPSSSAVTEMTAFDTPTPSKSGKKNQSRQRNSAVRGEVIIATRKANTLEFVKYYVFKRVPDGYTPKDGPPFADPAFAHYRWVMPPSSDDRVTWSVGAGAIKKNDTFPFQEEMVMRLAPDDPYLSRNYLYGGPLGPPESGEPSVTLAELMQQLAAKGTSTSQPSRTVIPAENRQPALVLEPPSQSAPTAVPASPPTVPTKAPSGINPIFTTDTSFTIPGTSPIGKDLIDNATENVNKAIRWLNPLIKNAKGAWADLLNLQPRDAANGIIGVHFSISPKPYSASSAPLLIMSKAAISLSIGIPAEHYRDPGAIFEDVLELLIWNMAPQQNHAAHDKLIREIKKSAGEFPYPGDPLPPEVLAKLGAGTSSQAKSLDPDTPDTGTSAGIYDGDIQGRVIGSTVRCFNFLFSKGVPYFTRLQNIALQQSKDSSEAGDADTARYWQKVATTLGDDIRTLNSLLEPLPHQSKVEFYFRPEEQTTTHRKTPKPSKIPESEPGVRMTIALTRGAYEQGPGTVKDALIQVLSNQAGGLPIGRAVDDFFLLFGEDPKNKGGYFAVTMQQLHPRPNESLAMLSELWSTRASEQGVVSTGLPAVSIQEAAAVAVKPGQLGEVPQWEDLDVIPPDRDVVVGRAPISQADQDPHEGPAAQLRRAIRTQGPVQAAPPAEKAKVLPSPVKSFKPDFSRVDDFPEITDVKQQAQATSFTNWLECYLKEAVIYLTGQKETLESALTQSRTANQTVQAYDLRNDQLQKAVGQITTDIDAATGLLKSLPQDTVVHFYMYPEGAERITSRLDGSTLHILIGAAPEDYHVVPASLKQELPRLMARMISALCRLTSGNDEQLVDQSVRQFIGLYASDPAHRDDELVKGLESKNSSDDSFNDTSRLNRSNGMTRAE
jgi:hypothetical protein